MAQWIVDDAAHPRRALFLRTQAPFVIVVMTLILLGFGLGLNSERDLATGVGVGVIAASTALSLIVPWERLRPSATAILPVLNLAGIAALAVSLHGSVNTVPVLAIFPAVWLSMDHDGKGTLVGIVGVFVASTLPLLLNAPAPTADDWIEALVVPVLVSAAAGASSVMANRTARAREALEAVINERDTAAAENARLGGALQSFARQVDIGVVFFDQHGDIVVSNNAAREFGELAAFDAAEESARLAFGEDQVTPIAPEEQPLNRVLAGCVVQDLILWVGPRGAQKALLANGAPVVSPTGSGAGSFLILQDVTTVIRSSRDREDALATLTHELRTPLTAIIGYLDLIELEDRPDDAEKISIASRNAEHMLALTSALLTDLRHPRELNRRPTRLSVIIEQSMTDAASLPGYWDRTLEIDTDDADVEMNIDPDAIRQVLDNLLSNAIKFSSRGDRVRVAAVRKPTGHVSISVSNEGANLTQDELERIFDRFYRGSNAQNQAVPGTGLGLTISRDIAQRHGGSLDATRETGWTALQLRLPMA